jgi:hypothetical protein
MEIHRLRHSHTGETIQFLLMMLQLRISLEMVNKQNLMDLRDLYLTLLDLKKLTQEPTNMTRLLA